MSQISYARVVAGGLAAGLVMNVVDAVANGLLLAARWQRETEALSATVMTRMTAMSAPGWIAVDFLTGLALVWLYAAIRPRFGPGSNTALLASGVMWVVTHLWYASYVFMGLFSVGLIGASSVAGLVGVLAGGSLGAFLYRE